METAGRSSSDQPLRHGLAAQWQSELEQFTDPVPENQCAEVTELTKQEAGSAAIGSANLFRQLQLKSPGLAQNASLVRVS
jgi:hypothetical protein